jgi:hypothetical protein
MSMIRYIEEGRKKGIFKERKKLNKKRNCF